MYVISIDQSTIRMLFEIQKKNKGVMSVRQFRAKVTAAISFMYVADFERRTSILKFMLESFFIFRYNTN